MSEGILTQLLGVDGALRKAYDGTDPVVLQGAVSLHGLPRISDIQKLIEGSLLRRLYFTVLRNGVKPPDSEVMGARKVAGVQVKGFLDTEGVQGHLSDGATLKLNQVEDWHPGISDINNEINSLFPVESKAFLFYTPAGKRGMLPHRDGSRVVAIQIEGTKEWHVYGTSADSLPDAGLDVDTTHERVVLMEPGDLLYLPHGHAHAATAVGDASLHLTFTLTEPFPSGLVKACIAEWIASGRVSNLVSDQPLPPETRVKKLLADLTDYTSAMNGQQLIDRALTTARTRDASR